MEYVHLSFCASHFSTEELKLPFIDVQLSVCVCAVKPVDMSSSVGAKGGELLLTTIMICFLQYYNNQYRNYNTDTAIQVLPILAILAILLIVKI